MVPAPLETSEILAEGEVTDNIESGVGNPVAHINGFGLTDIIDAVLAKSLHQEVNVAADESLLSSHCPFAESRAESFTQLVVSFV